MVCMWHAMLRYADTTLIPIHKKELCVMSGRSFPSRAHIMEDGMDYDRDSKKRKRISTAGCSERRNHPLGVSYAQVADFDVSSFSMNKEIDFLCSKNDNR